VSPATDDRDVTRRFEAMFRDHYPAVVRFCLRRADRAVADDVAAEVFTAAWRSMDVVPAAHPLPWLLGVARRQLANQHRTAGSHREKASQLGHVEQLTTRDHAAAVGERQAIVQAFAALSENDREVLRLVGWDGLSSADAARVLGISALAFRARTTRARRRLARGLADVQQEPLPVNRTIPEVHP
jgi:RNA polymerase sigma factor (sigma-70 family)